MIAINNIKYSMYLYTKRCYKHLGKLLFYVAYYLIKVFFLLHEKHIKPNIKKIEKLIYDQACEVFDCHKQQVR